MRCNFINNKNYNLLKVCCSILQMISSLKAVLLVLKLTQTCVNCVKAQGKKLEDRRASAKPLLLRFIMAMMELSGAKNT